MRRTLVLLAAAALVVTGATQSSADIPAPVTVETDGTCPSGYREIVRAGNVVVCLYPYRVPSVRPTTTGCGTGETPVLVDGRYGVCVG